MEQQFSLWLLDSPPSGPARHGRDPALVLPSHP